MMCCARSCRILLLVLIFASCGQQINDPLRDIRALVVNSLGEDISLIHTGNPPTLTNHAVTVGSAPNQVLMRGKEALVLSSRSNSLQVVDCESWTMAREYSLGDGCNPYMMALTEDGLLLVTCLLTNELLRVDPEADLAADPVLDRLSMPAGEDLLPYDPSKSGYARPQGVAVVGHKAYVTLSNLDDYWAVAGPGLVVVVDVAAWTKDKIIKLSKTNPASIYRPLSDGNTLYIPCSGPWPYDGAGVVVVLDATIDAVVATVEVGGAPGRMWVDEQGTGWVGDQSIGRLLRFEVGNRQVLGSLTICTSDGDFVADVATDGRGNVYVACFGTDAVHTFPAEDASNPRIFNVGDGPIALLVVQR